MVNYLLLLKGDLNQKKLNASETVIYPYNYSCSDSLDSGNDFSLTMRYSTRDMITFGDVVVNPEQPEFSGVITGRRINKATNTVTYSGTSIRGALSRLVGEFDFTPYREAMQEQYDELSGYEATIAYIQMNLNTQSARITETEQRIEYNKSYAEELQAEIAEGVHEFDAEYQANMDRLTAENASMQAELNARMFDDAEALQRLNGWKDQLEQAIAHGNQTQINSLQRTVDDKQQKYDKRIAQTQALIDSYSAQMEKNDAEYEYWEDLLTNGGETKTTQALQQKLDTINGYISSDEYSLGIYKSEYSDTQAEYRSAQQALDNFVKTIEMPTLTLCACDESSANVQTAQESASNKNYIGLTHYLNRATEYFHIPVRFAVTDNIDIENYTGTKEADTEYVFNYIPIPIEYGETTFSILSKIKELTEQTPIFSLDIVNDETVVKASFVDRKYITCYIKRKEVEYEENYDVTSLVTPNRYYSFSTEQYDYADPQIDLYPAGTIHPTKTIKVKPTSEVDQYDKWAFIGLANIQELFNSEEALGITMFEFANKETNAEYREAVVKELKKKSGKSSISSLTIGDDADIGNLGDVIAFIDVDNGNQTSNFVIAEKVFELSEGKAKITYSLKSDYTKEDFYNCDVQKYLAGHYQDIETVL